MQTFLPYPDFTKTFKCLDYRRLGKERIEAKQIHNIITGKAKPHKNGRVAWSSHPCVLMWIGHHHALALYHNLCIQEWINRGYNNNMPLLRIYEKKIIMPWWMGNESFHSSHRQTLLYKNFDYYKQS